MFILYYLCKGKFTKTLNIENIVQNNMPKLFFGSNENEILKMIWETQLSFYVFQNKNLSKMFGLVMSYV